MNEPTETAPKQPEANEQPAATDAPSTDSTGDGAAPKKAPTGADSVTIRPGGQEQARRAGRAGLRRARERAERAASALEAVRTTAREIASMQDAIPCSMDSDSIRAVNTALRAALRSIEADVHAGAAGVQDAEHDWNETLNRLNFRVPDDLPF